MIERVFWIILLLVIGTFVVVAKGQSSSLFVEDVPAQPSAVAAPRVASSPSQTAARLSPGLAATSHLAVIPPEPRFFAVHDLVTIIVRESTEAESESTLETEKKVNFDGQISAWPGVRGLDDLWNLFLKTDLSANPRLAAEFRKKFEGDGEYERTDKFTTRLTARILDVKPNGTLVLEARKFIRSDREELEMVLTGVCRAEDVTADNTVLSTQLYDLRLDKQHRGELKNATKKGILTKVFETLFAF